MNNRLGQKVKAVNLLIRGLGVTKYPITRKEWILYPEMSENLLIFLKSCDFNDKKFNSLFPYARGINE